MTKKSLCVVTGTRAEYGLLRPVLQKLLQSDVIEPRLVVTGAHLAPEFGNTVSEIEADGMPIAARIPILKFGTGSPLATARTVSYTMERFTDYFTRCLCWGTGMRYLPRARRPRCWRSRWRTSAAVT